MAIDKSAWKNSKPVSFEKTPDGEYAATILKAEFTMTKKDPPRPMFSLEFLLQNGRKHWVNMMMNSEVGMGIVKQNLINCGFSEDQVEDIDYVESNLEMLIGNDVQIKVETNNGFTNTNIMHLIRDFTQQPLTKEEEAIIPF